MSSTLNYKSEAAHMRVLLSKPVYCFKAVSFELVQFYCVKDFNIVYGCAVQFLIGRPGQMHLEVVLHYRPLRMRVGGICSLEGE